jgi:hypothetical protein
LLVRWQWLGCGRSIGTAVAKHKRHVRGAAKRLADSGARDIEESLAQVLTGKRIGHADDQRILRQIESGCAAKPGCVGASRDTLSNALKRGLPDLSRIHGRTAARLVSPHDRRAPIMNIMTTGAFVSVSLNLETVQTPRRMSAAIQKMAWRFPVAKSVSGFIRECDNDCKMIAFGPSPRRCMFLTSNTAMWLRLCNGRFSEQPLSMPSANPQPTPLCCACIHSGTAYRRGRGQSAAIWRRRLHWMKHGNRQASQSSQRGQIARVALVLLTLTLLVLVSGCGLRGNRNGASQPWQQSTSQQTTGQQPNAGSNGASQQVQNADQQVQDAMNGINNAQNDANNANNQSGQENDLVP